MADCRPIASWIARWAWRTQAPIRSPDASHGQERPTYLVGLLRQSVFGRLVGYEDVNDADRLWSATGRSRELPFLPARWAASNRSGRSENLAALADLPGRRIDKVHER
jgi:hypothetical protein